MWTLANGFFFVLRYCLRDSSYTNFFCLLNLFSSSVFCYDYDRICIQSQFFSITATRWLYILFFVFFPIHFLKFFFVSRYKVTSFKERPWHFSLFNLAIKLMIETLPIDSYFFFFMMTRTSFTWYFPRIDFGFRRYATFVLLSLVRKISSQGHRNWKFVRGIWRSRSKSCSIRILKERASFVSQEDGFARFVRVKHQKTKFLILFGLMQYM